MMQNDTPRPYIGDPTSWMPGYRVVIYGSPGQDVRVRVIHAEDDDEALSMAVKAAGPAAFELWDALTLIGRYGPGS